MAPVPEAVSSSTSCPVLRKRRRPERHSRTSARNSSLRWWGIGRASASWTRGKRGVGPGVNNLSFFSMDAGPLPQKLWKTLWKVQDVNALSCHPGEI
jgi:hypothetical protein